MIEHLIIFFGFFTLLSGGFALINSITGVIRINDSFRNSYLVFFTCFTASVFLYVLITYLKVNVESSPSLFIYIWAFVDVFFDIAIIITAILFFHNIYNIPYKNYFFYPLIIITLIVYAVFFLAAFELLPRFFILTAMIYYRLLFTYLIIVNLLNVWKLKGYINRFFGYGLFAFGLYGFIESLSSFPDILFTADFRVEWLLPKSFYASTIPYLIWSILSTVLLWKPYHPKKRGDYITELCSKYSISKRESDVLRLIISGKSNQEIGQNLFISLQTVKTHAHHIYEKTGTKSRMELASLFQS